jgi:hypothetical protein
MFSAQTGKHLFKPPPNRYPKPSPVFFPSSLFICSRLSRRRLTASSSQIVRFPISTDQSLPNLFSSKRASKWCYKSRKMDDLTSDCPNNVMGVGAEDSRKLRRLANFDIATGEHDLDLRQAASSSLMPYKEIKTIVRMMSALPHCHSQLTESAFRPTSRSRSANMISTRGKRQLLSDGYQKRPVVSFVCPRPQPTVAKHIADSAIRPHPRSFTPQPQRQYLPHLITFSCSSDPLRQGQTLIYLAWYIRRRVQNFDPSYDIHL